MPKSKFITADRLNLPAYPFAELERKATALRLQGRRIYDLSIGDPDLPPPAFVIQAVKNALDDPRSHFYPSSRGDKAVRQAVAQWFKGRFGLEVNPDTEICITIGGKEALSQFARAIVNPGEIVAFPDPCYPVFRRAGCFMLDAKPLPLPLDPENGFLPDIRPASEARLLFINYPNNPTGATAPVEFQKQLAHFADRHSHLTVAYDMAYSEMTFGEPTHSLLEFSRNVVEFHSLSKMANATGYRIGFAVGEASRISALVRVKEEMDSGAPLPFQLALKAVLESYNDATTPIEMTAFREIYKERRSLLGKAIKTAGYHLFDSDATFYLWFKVGDDEVPFISRYVDAGVLFTPGSGFGGNGKGWVRASVTASDEDIQAATEIIGRNG